MFLANKKMILDFAVTLGGSSRGRERDTKFFDLAGVFFFFRWWDAFEHIKTPHLRRGDRPDHLERWLKLLDEPIKYVFRALGYQDVTISRG